MNRIVLGDNLGVLQQMKAGSIELIYVDPPFNTGKRQNRTQMKTVHDETGDRVGFGGDYQEPLSKVVGLHVNTLRECVKAFTTRGADGDK